MMDGDEPVAVVMNATVYTVIVDPMVTDQAEAEAKLTGILGDKRVAEWGDVFADKSRRYYIVGKNVERRAAEQVAEADLAGCGFRRVRSGCTRRGLWRRRCSGS